MDLPLLPGPIIPEDVAGAVGAVELYVFVVLSPPPVQDAYHLDPALPEQERPGRLLRLVPFVANHTNLHAPLPAPYRLPRQRSLARSPEPVSHIFNDPAKKGHPSNPSRHMKPDCPGCSSYREGKGNLIKEAESA